LTFRLLWISMHTARSPVPIGKMTSKAKRQAVLRELIETHEITSQEQLVQLLLERGITATQASVSRDVRELGLIKVHGRYVSLSRLTEENGPVTATINGDLVTNITPVGANLVIVHAIPAAASAVAAQIDAAKLPDVVGTVAGDDTVFIAVPSRVAQGRVIAWLRRTLRGRQSASGAIPAPPPPDDSRRRPR